MNLLTVDTDLASIFLLTTLFPLSARELVKKAGLMGKPNLRKRHQGSIPFVRGVSVYVRVCSTFETVDYYILHASLCLVYADVLVFIGTLGNCFDVSVGARVTIQAAISTVMMVFGKPYLSNPGYTFGPQEMVLRPFGYFLTLFTVRVAINASNMVDDIDGPLGGLFRVSSAAVGMVLWFDGQASFVIWCFVMIAAILPYIMLNLGILDCRYKVFMGNTGGTLTGFTITRALFETTQGKTHPINPVIALRVTATPLTDMVAIMYRHLRKDMSSFSPDHQHTHHLTMHAGSTSHQTPVLTIPTAALLASIDVLAEYSHFVPEWIMSVFFLPIFFLCEYCIKRAQKAVRFAKRVERRLCRGRGGSPNLIK